jgi:hypothetical protein
MRDLKKDDRNKLVLDDTLSGTKIGVFYATPTTSQVKSYRQQSIRRKGNKVVVDNFDPALKFGLEILTGFEEGAFGYDGQPISADPASPHYREDWKVLLKETAADIVTTVAHIVFDGIRSGQNADDVEFGEEAEEIVPLGKS